MINYWCIKNKVLMLCFLFVFFFTLFCYIIILGGRMKKIFILFVTIIMLTGCKAKSYQEISYKELNDMLEDKESFILFIGSSTCSACARYEVTLNDVIEEYGTDVKYIDLSKLSDKDESALVSEFPIDGTPTTIFIEKGEEDNTYNRIEGAARRSKIIEKFEENGYIKD